MERNRVELTEPVVPKHLTVALLGWAALLCVSAKAEQSFSPAQITSVATGKLTKSGDALDVAMLVAPPGDSDADHTLVILTPQDGGWEGTVEPLRVYENAVWGGVGETFGNKPSVAFSPAGSLLLNSHNEAFGRHRWTQTVTLIWRDDDLVVAGFTWTEYDTLDPDANGTCDVNLLSGRADVTKNGKSGKVDIGKARLSFADWLANGSPSLCPKG